MIGRRYRRSSGLGAQTCARDDTGKTCFVWDSGGNLIDCYAFKNYLNPTCWSGLKPFDVTAISDGSLPSPPAPRVVGAPTGTTLTIPPASGAEAQATVNDLLTQQMLGSQADTQQFFQNLNTTVNPAPDCTSWWTYMTNSNCPVDCSRFPTSLFNSSCPGLGLGSPLIMPLAIAAGVLLLVVVIRR